MSVCLIGLCGATPAGIDALEEHGLLQTISQGAARGSIHFPAPLSAVAAWTTLITGRSPAQHGIFDQFRRESSRGHRLRTVNARDLACDAVWSYLDRQGMSSTILDYPLTLPPPRIAGHVATGSWASSRQLRFGCHPSDLPRRLLEAGFGAIEEFLLAWPAEELPSADVAEAWVQNQIKRESRLLRILRHFLPVHLNAVLLRAFGRVYSWYERSPELRPAAQLYFEALGRELDQLRTAHPEIDFVVLSEPGAGSCSSTFYINEWLAGLGQLAWADRGAAQTVERAVPDTDQLVRQAKLIDWTRTRAWSPLAGNGELHLVRQDEEHPAGIAESEYREYRGRLISSLEAAPEVERVWTREELFPGPHEQLAPDLVVEPTPGIRISPLAGEVTVIQNTVTFEEAFPAPPPAGIMRAFGPSFHAGPLAKPVSLLDVAPLIFYSLGMSVPAALEGRVPTDMIDPAKLLADPPRIENAAESSVAISPRLDPAAEAEIFERLRSLGYVE